MSKIYTSSKEEWQEKAYSFFSHTKCEAFPCHSKIIPKDFNCLFCYCPLYFLGSTCGGNFTLLADGTKDCHSCTIPHQRQNYGYIIKRLMEAIHPENSKDI